MIPPKEGLEVIGCQQHLDMAAEAADLGISLVKDTLNQLPSKIISEIQLNIKV